MSPLQSYSSNTFPYVIKWLQNTNFHYIWSISLWTSSKVMEAQLTQTLERRYGQYMGSYHKQNKKTLK